MRWDETRWDERQRTDAEDLLRLSQLVKRLGRIWRWKGRRVVPVSHRSVRGEEANVYEEREWDRNTYTVVGQRRTQEQETVDRTDTNSKCVIMKMVWRCDEDVKWKRGDEEKEHRKNKTKLRKTEPDWAHWQERSCQHDEARRWSWRRMRGNEDWRRMQSWSGDRGHGAARAEVGCRKWNHGWNRMKQKAESWLMNTGCRERNSGRWRERAAGNGTLAEGGVQRI